MKYPAHTKKPQYIRHEVREALLKITSDPYTKGSITPEEARYLVERGIARGLLSRPKCTSPTSN